LGKIGGILDLPGFKNLEGLIIAVAMGENFNGPERKKSGENSEGI